MTLALQVGDVFVTTNPAMLARMINGAQRFWSSDNSSNYSHAGIITSINGGTFEALRKIRVGSLAGYAGQKIFIVRPEAEPQAKRLALRAVRQEHEGQIYPAWRLLFHLVPPLAKYVSASGRYVVCSELVAKYLWASQCRHDQYAGTTPDRLADEWHHWEGYELVYEGLWKPGLI